MDISNVKMAINPFCEIAVEEAVRLKEKKVAQEVRPEQNQDADGLRRHCQPLRLPATLSPSSAGRN